MGNNKGIYTELMKDRIDTAQSTNNEIKEFAPILPNKPDDLFITCASFESRSLGLFTNSSTRGYRSRWACIFKHDPDPDEDQEFEIDRQKNYKEIVSYLSPKIIEGISPIICSRTNVLDGMSQFSVLWETYWKPKACNLITIDITTFTKLYLLELLHFIIVKNGIKNLRIVYNQARSYGHSLLTQGVGQVICFPSFPGKFIATKETVLIACLGFETERAIGIWHACEPNKMIAIIGNPPLRSNYVKHAIEANSFLLTRAGVQVRYGDYYNPFSMAILFEDIYKKECIDEEGNPLNIAIMSLGTKPQTIGAFLFWLYHQNIRQMYAFPRAYGAAYHLRKPGKNYSFNLDLPLEVST